MRFTSQSLRYLKGYDAQDEPLTGEQLEKNASGELMILQKSRKGETRNQKKVDGEILTKRVA